MSSPGGYSKKKSPAIGKTYESGLMPYRWLMLALVWLLYFSFGVILGGAAPLVTPMLRDLNLLYGQMGFILGSWQLTYIAVAIIAGVIIDKWGLRKSLFVGALMMGLSAVLRYFAIGFGTLLIPVIIFGLGGPMVSIGAPKIISVWFRGKDRGTAVGIYSTAPRVGRIFVLALTHGFVMPLTGYNWRLTFVCYGFLTFAIAMLWWVFSKDVPAVETQKSLPVGQVLGLLLKIKDVRIILIAAFLLFNIGHGFVNWLPKILETNGMSPTMAGYVSTIPLIASLPSVIIYPRLVSPHYRGRFISLLALFAVIAVFLVVTSTLPLFIGLILFGITEHSITPLLMTTLIETPEVGPKYMGSAGGIFFCAAQVGGCLGPFAIGLLYDLTGTFVSGAIYLGILGLGIFALMFRLKTSSTADPGP